MAFPSHPPDKIGRVGIDWVVLAAIVYRKDALEPLTGDHPFFNQGVCQPENVAWRRVMMAAASP
jgi:hypothetical protein